MSRCINKTFLSPVALIIIAVLSCNVRLTNQMSPDVSISGVYEAMMIFSETRDCHDFLTELADCKRFQLLIIKDKKFTYLFRSCVKEILHLFVKKQEMCIHSSLTW